MWMTSKSQIYGPTYSTKKNTGKYKETHKRNNKLQYNTMSEVNVADIQSWLGQNFLLIDSRILLL